MSGTTKAMQELFREYTLATCIELFRKYVVHVAYAEGGSFARDLDMSPCDMGDNEYTPAERDLMKVVLQTFIPKERFP